MLDLIGAGFKVKKGTKGNHHKYTHSALASDGFYTGRFDGGHGKQPVVKRFYINDAIKIMKKYEIGLRKFLNEKSGDES